MNDKLTLFYQIFVQARCQWLTPVILATQEAEIREDHSLKPALANSSWYPSTKKKKKRKKKEGWWRAQGKGSEFKPQYCKKKKKFVQVHIDIQDVRYNVSLFKFHLSNNLSSYFENVSLLMGEKF
jgi:hypothetical protein